MRSKNYLKADSFNGGGLIEIARDFKPNAYAVLCTHM